MSESILITALTVLVIILAVEIFLRRRRTRGAVLLSEGVVNELLSAVILNAGTGRISEIAARVTQILQKYLKCDRVIFLKNSRGVLDLTHSVGLDETDPRVFRHSLSDKAISYFKKVGSLAPISDLNESICGPIATVVVKQGFNYFFAINLRGHMSGIYFIKSRLPADDPFLRLLASALTYSLSAADYIRRQNRKIRSYENRVRELSGEQAINQSDYIGSEFKRLLKAKNYNQLVSELVKQQAREEGLSRLGFYSKAENDIDQPIAVSWQIKDSTDKIIKDYFKEILPQLTANEVYDINNLKLKYSQTAEPLETLSGNDVKYLASIPWVNNTRAILAWADDKVEKISGGTLFDFWRNAIPLAEHISRFEKAEEMSYTDALTGTYNLRYFRKRLVEEFNRANRYGRFLTLMIIDVDELKTINDNYGHQAGDRLLKKFARVLLQSVRGNDVISRYGGDEFCLIMPETSRNRARLIMDRIQKMISQNPMEVGEIQQEKYYTVSIGGAVYPDDARTVEELIKAADMALLQAKSRGRNCGCMFSSEPKGKPS